MAQVPEEYILSRLRNPQTSSDQTDLAARVAALEALLGKLVTVTPAGEFKMPAITGDIEKRILETRSLANENLLERLRRERLERETEDDKANQTILEEISARIAGDDTLSASIVTEQLARITADEDVIAMVTTEIAAEAAARTASIAAEASTRAAADGTLTATINTEVAARVAGDTDLEAQVDEERTARIAADGTITASLDTEVTARVNGDSSLSSAISTEAIARANADGSLAAEYVLSVVTDGGVRRVTGFRITNLGGAGGYTEFVVQADRFAIVNPSGGGFTVPFVVEGGVVYIDVARIRDLTVGTTKLANNAATTLASATGSGVSGNGGFQLIGQLVVSVSYDAEILVMADIQQDFPSGARTFEISLQEDGSQIAYAQGSSISQFPALRSTRSKSPGTYTYEIWWKGQNSGIIATTNTLIAFSRYK